MLDIEESDYHSKCEAIVEWVYANKKDLDVGFVEDMLDRLDRGKYLTESQQYAIDLLYEKTVLSEDGFSL